MPLPERCRVEVLCQLGPLPDPTPRNCGKGAIQKQEEAFQSSKLIHSVLWWDRHASGVRSQASCSVCHQLVLCSQETAVDFSPLPAAGSHHQGLARVIVRTKDDMPGREPFVAFSWYVLVPITCHAKHFS